MSISPKYGRVYTRINGGVSCKAITFPFLRFRCAREEKGSKMREREGETGSAMRDKERGKVEEADRARYVARGWGTDAVRHTYTYDEGTRDFMRGLGTGATRSNDPAGIYNGGLLIVGSLIALRTPLYARS